MKLEDIRLTPEEVQEAVTPEFIKKGGGTWGLCSFEVKVANTATDKAIKKMLEFVEDKMAQSPAGCEGYLCMDCTDDWTGDLRKLVEEA